eukprot:s3485_g19.t1
MEPDGDSSDAESTSEVDEGSSSSSEAGKAQSRWPSLKVLVPALLLVLASLLTSAWQLPLQRGHLMAQLLPGLLSLCFAMAFLSFWWQADGLVGPKGIVPIADQGLPKVQALEKILLDICKLHKLADSLTFRTAVLLRWVLANAMATDREVPPLRTSRSSRSGRSRNSRTSNSHSHFALHVRRNLWSWICWAVGLIFVKLIFAISNVLLPVILLGQMLMLDNAMLKHHTWAAIEWLWIVFLAQLVLFLHLVATNLTSSRQRGGLQWIVYCWIISVVAGILFFDTLPQMQRIQHETNPLLLDLLSSRSLITVMWLTPLFYAVLTFRTLRQLFQQDVRGKTASSEGDKETNQNQRKNNSVTLDAALLQDMVWHTDMIDIVNMMFMDSADQNEGASTQFLSVTHPEEVKRIQIAAGTFIILGLFFHQQSYPSYLARSVWCVVRFGIQCIGGDSSQETETPDVVKARKRSAIISILLVDLPFFTIRTYIYTLGLSMPNTPYLQIDGKEVHRPQLDKWWVKNILCMMLQAMQLRFVQQAEQERSQSLRWWDVRRQADAASQVSLRTKGLAYNANLMDAYKDRHMTQNKLEYAFAELGALNDMSPSTTQAASSVADEAGEQEGGDVEPKKCRFRCRCCCRSCFSKSITSFQIFCHTVMGLVLGASAMGWFIAKAASREFLFRSWMLRLIELLLHMVQPRPGLRLCLPGLLASAGSFGLATLQLLRYALAQQPELPSFSAGQFFLMILQCLLYRSLFYAGQDFMALQWDALLHEDRGAMRVLKQPGTFLVVVDSRMLAKIGIKWKSATWMKNMRKE